MKLMFSINATIVIKFNLILSPVDWLKEWGRGYPMSVLQYPLMWELHVCELYSFDFLCVLIVYMLTASIEARSDIPVG